MSSLTWPCPVPAAHQSERSAVQGRSCMCMRDWWRVLHVHGGMVARSCMGDSDRSRLTVICGTMGNAIHVGRGRTIVEAPRSGDGGHGG